jgi:HD-GYP domain-containing protein (c-di-GMP phosphodiesterase class II)
LDSILSDRPQRPKQTDEAARKEIAAWSGRQFDPRVVEAFLSMPEEIWDKLRRDCKG